MQTNGNAPRCPKPERLHELVELVGEEQIDAKAQADLIDALEWLANMLENRALYHKKRNVKNAILLRLAQENGLIDEANSLTRDALHDYVGKSKPDEDFEIELESDRR
jgi:hypothetical protein